MRAALACRKLAPGREGSNICLPLMLGFQSSGACSLWGNTAFPTVDDGVREAASCHESYPKCSAKLNYFAVVQDRIGDSDLQAFPGTRKVLCARRVDSTPALEVNREFVLCDCASIVPLFHASTAVKEGAL